MPSPDRLFRGPGRVPDVLALVAGIACVIALGYRCRYASDITDETFSIAMPYRFALGDKPFVDEVSIQQTAGLLLFPFVWLYVKITGGTTGIVLFVRGVHVFFKALTALCVYRAARELLRYRSSAIAVAFVPFAFVPFSIPNVGYNLLGMTLVAGGAFLVAAAIAYPAPRPKLLALGGLAQAFGVLAYPPMIVAPFVTAPLLLLCAPSRKFVSVACFAAGCAAALVIVSPAFAFGGVAGVRRALAFGVHSTTPGSERLKDVLEAFWDGTPWIYPYALVALVVARALRSRAGAIAITGGVTLALLLWFRDEAHSHLQALHTVMYVGAFAPALLVVAGADRKLWRAAAIVLLPSFAVGAACAAFSTNAVAASSLGFYAATIMFALLAARAVEDASTERVLGTIPAFAIALVLITSFFDFVYRDHPTVQLTTYVDSGPFKGIYTSADRAAMFSELNLITQKFDRPKARVAFLYDVPGLFLFSRNRPSTNSVWQVTWYGQRELVDYWSSHATGKGYVVFSRSTGRGPLDAQLGPPSRKIHETPHFVVYSEE